MSAEEKVGSGPKDPKDTYVVRWEHEIVVRCGTGETVEEAAKIFQESVVLNPELKLTVTKLDPKVAPETRMRIKRHTPESPPMFYRRPLSVPSIEALALLDAEPYENAKVAGVAGEGYAYRPDIKAGADGLDLRYTVSSRGPKGGVWVDVVYLRQAAQAAHAQAVAQQQQRAQQAPPGLRGLNGGKR